MEKSHPPDAPLRDVVTIVLDDDDDDDNRSTRVISPLPLTPPLYAAAVALQSQEKDMDIGKKRLDHLTSTAFRNTMTAPGSTFLVPPPPPFPPFPPLTYDPSSSFVYYRHPFIRPNPSHLPLLSHLPPPPLRRRRPSLPPPPAPSTATPTYSGLPKPVPCYPSPPPGFLLRPPPLPLLGSPSSRKKTAKEVNRTKEDPPRRETQDPQEHHDDDDDDVRLIENKKRDAFVCVYCNRKQPTSHRKV